MASHAAWQAAINRRIEEMLRRISEIRPRIAGNHLGRNDRPGAEIREYRLTVVENHWRLSIKYNSSQMHRLFVAVPIKRKMPKLIRYRTH